jgi:hypothetical protein
MHIPTVQKTEGNLKVNGRPTLLSLLQPGILLDFPAICRDF